MGVLLMLGFRGCIKLGMGARNGPGLYVACVAAVCRLARQGVAAARMRVSDVQTCCTLYQQEASTASLQRSGPALTLDSVVGTYDSSMFGAGRERSRVHERRRGGCWCRPGQRNTLR